MKKTYLKPMVETVIVGMQQPIAASGISFSDETGIGTLNDESAEEALSRELDLW